MAGGCGVVGDAAVVVGCANMVNRIDNASSRRIELLTRMMSEMGRVTDPRAAFDLFARGMRETSGGMNVAQLSTRGLEAGQYRAFLMRTADGVAHVDRGDPWGYEGWPVEGAGVFAELVRAGGPVVIREADLSGDPVVGRVFGRCRSVVAAPLLIPDLPVNWLVFLHEEPDYFGAEYVEEMILRSNLMGALIKGLQASQELAAANVRITREIEQIARIQRTLLPSQLPEIPGLAIAAHYETFDQAGGDLYDFSRMEGDPTTDHDDRWAILIADASGHGPAAATVCAIVHSILHAYPREPKGPGELIRHVNRHLCAKQIESSFVTAFLAFYQPATRELVYVRAGHNPPLLVSCPGETCGRRTRTVVRQLSDATGLPLGIDADATFNEERVILERGQMVVLYTDGVTDAKGPDGAMLGVEGIERALAGCGDGAREAVRCLDDAVREHQGPAGRATDDQTVLVIEVE
jgi:sigma-B regulation protein RsbU (phosphoserine phosphatase)